MYHPVTGACKNVDQLKQQEPTKWDTGMRNKMGRLTKWIGTCMIDGTDTMFYIKGSQVPAWKKVTYANAIWDFPLLKDNPYWIRLTVRGDWLCYDGASSAPAASLIDSNYSSIVSFPLKEYASSPPTSKITFSTTQWKILSTWKVHFDGSQLMLLPNTILWKMLIRRFCICWNTKGYVWTSTGCTNSIQSSGHAHGAPRILPTALQSWNVVSWRLWHHSHPLCWQFWHQRFKPGRCKPSTEYVTKILQNFNRSERKIILWLNIRLALC